jgi:hypothetical protein
VDSVSIRYNEKRIERGNPDRKSNFPTRTRYQVTGVHQQWEQVTAIHLDSQRASLDVAGSHP